jgi:excisionase family DNA binding protein
MSSDSALPDLTQGAYTHHSTQLRDRLTCTVREACSATGIGKTKMHELISGGAVESAKIGRRRLVKVPSLLRLVGQEPRPFGEQVTF